MHRLAKICGVRSPEALVAAAQGGASHAGLVFVPASPRGITMVEAAALAARAPSRLGLVGLFVDASPEAILAAVRDARLVAVQLHGGETPAFAAALRQALPPGVELWRAAGVATRAEAETAARLWAGLADRLLLDARPPPGAALPGGNAVRIDWPMLAGFAPPLPWALAGGLTPDNVAGAIALTNAPMVDVSSGVEDAPGMKSTAKIAAFLAAVAAAR